MRPSIRERSSSSPLAGVRVVVTRPPHQAGGLAAAFRELGAAVELLPLLEVVEPADPAPLDRAALEIDRYAWIAFTSANAVGPLVARRLPPWPDRTRVAAVGEGTAAALRGAGSEPDLVAERSGGADLADEILAAATRHGGESVRGVEGVAVLLPQAADARPDLERGLRAAGFEVDAVVAYDKRTPPEAVRRARDLFPAGAPLGWVTFTSPRIARTFAELVDGVDAGSWADRRRTLRAASIGQTTSGELRRLGVEPATEARSPSDAALAEAVARAVAGAARS